MESVVKQLSNYDKYYAHYTLTESLLMTLIAAVSNFFTVPVVITSIIMFCSMMTSFFYHFTQIYNWTIFLDFSAWHRLDNVFAVSAMRNLQIISLQYSAVIVAILAQQKDPWNLNYTIGPIILFFIVGIVSNIYYKIGFPEYDYNQLIRGKVLLFLGAYFFAQGLDQHTDYLRFNHGVWHVFLGVASYYNINAIKKKTQYLPLNHNQ